MMDNTINNASILGTAEQKQSEQPLLKSDAIGLQKKNGSEMNNSDNGNKDVIKELEALSYSISHDLHAPLRIIRNNCELLDRINCLMPGTDEEKLIQQIAASSERMEKLLDALLEFSRFVRIKPSYSLIDMTVLVKDITNELLGLEHDQSNITINTEPLLEGHGDPVLLRQVWHNLISNALKFTIHKPDRIIKIESYGSSEEVVYCISDNGAGFDMHYAEKLFCAFSRLHGIEEFDGTGVGLAIVQRVVERHGGHVWAEGEIDNGARFYFTLPKRT